MATYWPVTNEDTGVWFRNQTDFVTAAADGTESDWTKLTCEFELPQMPDNTIKLTAAVGQAGATQGVLPGSEDGITFKLKGQIRSQLAGWDPTATITKSPEIDLISDFLGGSATRDYQATSVGVGSDANTVTIGSGTYADGHFVGYGASATAVDVRNWVKTAGASQELIEDSESVAADQDNGYGAVTMWPATTQPTPKTFRFLSNDTTGWRDIRLVGCVAGKCTLTMPVGSVWTWEMEFTATQLQWDTLGTDIVPAPTYQTLPAFIGTNYGRVTVNLVATSDGNVDATDAYCDIAEIAVTITRSVSRVPCPSSPEGVSNVILGSPQIMLTAQTPIQSDDISGGETIWETRYNASTLFSFCAYIGWSAGRMAALCIPAAQLNKRPTLAKVGGEVVGHQLEMVPGPYTGDTSATAPGDTPFRFAVA
jgi:hypothetical protein